MWHLSVNLAEPLPEGVADVFYFDLAHAVGCAEQQSTELT
jgi:hypothetical protein